MPHYKTIEGTVSFLDSRDFEYMLPAGSFEITDEEAESIRNPPLTNEQLVTNAFFQRDNLLAAVSLRIAPLNDAVDLGMATNEEKSTLLALKVYRVELNRIEQQDGFPTSIVWPVSP